MAINPYQSLPIYGNETIMAYHGNESRDMDPHVYGVTEQAFRQMKRCGPFIILYRESSTIMLMLYMFYLHCVY